MTYKIALAGNPNVGKSTIFNQLTGLKQHTGNWAGKTVENAKGEYTYQKEKYEIYDLPGTYSISSHSKEEEIATSFLLKNNIDLTIVICNAVCLERSLNLALQIMNITNNVIIVINLMDEAQKKKIHIDTSKLSNYLKVPIIEYSAINKKGLLNLKETIKKTITNLPKETSPKYYPILETHKICKEIITIKDDNYLKRERKIDRILTNRITGIPIMLMILFIIFWLTIVGSNYPSDILFNFFSQFEKKLIVILSFLPKDLNNILTLGLYKTTTWVISVMLPPMLIFFPLFTILEDIGLLPRIAFNLDSAFQKCNSCGKQSLTMCMGIGCNAVGVTGTRIIDAKRERYLAILTNSLMPCNGRYPTIIAIISMFFIGTSKGLIPSIISSIILVTIIIVSIIMTFISNKILSKYLLKGDNVSFILELSDYRRIKLIPLIIRSILDRTIYVLGRALLISAPAGIIIYLITNYNINNISIIHILSNTLNPIGKILGLDGTILLSFILGFPANEIVMPIMLMIYQNTNTLTNYTSLNSLKNILIDNNWNLITAISFIIFTVFHFPCSTTILTIKKETNSWFYTIISLILPLTIGVVLCILINLLKIILY